MKPDAAAPFDKELKTNNAESSRNPFTVYSLLSSITVLCEEFCLLDIVWPFSPNETETHLVGGFTGLCRNG
ncbi:MAG: hypothetical protein ACRC4Q_08575, partial [Paraclostridium dentum]